MSSLSVIEAGLKLTNLVFCFPLYFVHSVSTLMLSVGVIFGICYVLLNLALPSYDGYPKIPSFILYDENLKIS